LKKINEISYANRCTAAQNSITNLMKTLSIFKAKIYFTGIISISIWGLLAWDYFHGGVPSHHILHREDLPEFSNWWGGILLPLLTWFLLYRIQKRENLTKIQSPFPIKVIYGFLAALLFGVLLSIFFSFGNTEMPGYMVLGLPVLALFYPIYRAECFLGFVIGMTFIFGGVLPTGIGSIFAIIAFLIHKLVRPVGLYVVRLLKILPKKDEQND
jgi:hypothetical protein